MRRVTVMIEGAPLVTELTEEEWTEYSRQEAVDIFRAQEWRRKMDALNAATVDPPPGRGPEAMLGYGCAGALFGAGVVIGVLLMVLLRHG